MKKLLIIFFVFGFVQMNAATKEHCAAKSEIVKQGREQQIAAKDSYSPSAYPFIFENYSGNGQKWGVFWINFAIGAIGMYSIYGFGAGIVSAGITYFVVNGDKKSFHMAMWGAASGMAVGLILRLMYLYL